MKLYSCAVGALVACILAANVTAQEADKAAVQRGALAVRGKPPMNPGAWSAKTYDNVWKQWGLKEKPADFAKAVRDRYGLHEAPYDNDGLPMGLHYSKGLFGKAIVGDCLLCHAGVVAGQTIIGAPNASLDLQSLFDDLSAMEKLPLKFPVRFGHGRGTIDPVNPVTFLAEMRDADINLQTPRVKLDYTDNVNSDPPAWWLLKRKKTRNWSGGVQVNSVRVDMVNLLSPLNSAAHIKKHEPTFADIHAFILTVQTPKYPFAVDAGLAAKGQGLFNEHCARCHGTYGPGAKYPNKIVALETVGTDRTLATSLTPKNIDHFNKSWFGQEKTPDGKLYSIVETEGYQAPPLDGVWATAPYFHNGSVPTLAHVLNSKARPKIFTRSYGTAKEDYDAERVGWKTTVLDKAPSADLPGPERRKIYDTTVPGRSNAGHAFGDQFTNGERRAVIEYLKTL